MEPRRLLTFRAVARQRSFSRAARELALSQPSVSQQVAALEREVGTRLLDRRPGGLLLTHAGEVLLEHVDAIAERLALATTQLREIAQDEQSLLRIGAFATALAGLVPAAVAHVRARSPDVRVSVDEAPVEALPGHLLAGDLHLAITYQDAALPRREHQGLERRDLLREAFLVAMPADHPLAARRDVRLADFAEDGRTAGVTDGLIVRACRCAGFEPRLVSITSDQLAIRALIARGMAVTLTPQLLAEAFQDVALRPIAGGGPQRGLYPLLPPDHRHPLALQALAALQDIAAALPAPRA